MGKISLVTFIFALSFSFSKCHLVWNDPNSLHPVHGLYVKPSADGSTGDLYVAATENTGAKAQWLTDQPINFLGAATQLQPAVLPVSLTSSLTKTSTPHEESVETKKRAVMTNSPFNYAYALPMASPDGSLLTPYPYAMATNTEGSSAPSCSEGVASHYSAAFQYFYPQMMAAVSRAMKTFNAADEQDSKSKEVKPSAPFWPQAYPYPYQYVMVDPSTWAQSQTESTAQAQSTSEESS